MILVVFPFFFFNNYSDNIWEIVTFSALLHVELESSQLLDLPFCNELHLKFIYLNGVVAFVLNLQLGL